MRFWDSSAVVCLCLREPHRAALSSLSRIDPGQVVWWATRTECLSALERGLRAGKLDVSGLSQARVALRLLATGWDEILPAESIRGTAERSLGIHSLSAADAFQLAAALDWCSLSPLGREFVTLDRQLGEAARREGFTVLP